MGQINGHISRQEVRSRKSVVPMESECPILGGYHIVSSWCHLPIKSYPRMCIFAQTHSSLWGTPITFELKVRHTWNQHLSHIIRPPAFHRHPSHLSTTFSRWDTAYNSRPEVTNPKWAVPKESPCPTMPAHQVSTRSSYLPIKTYMRMCILHKPLFTPNPNPNPKVR